MDLRSGPRLYLALTNPPVGGPQKPTTMAGQEGYCVKCKAKREIKDAKEVTMANGRKALKGVCPKCGTGMFKILGK